jgi:molybdopterin molybdotransferase
MLSFDQARSLLLARAVPLSSERVALSQAFGRVLAEPLIAGANIPAFAYSAMDGYALATADLGAQGPFQLPIVGESRTGRPSQPLVPGTASLISTGAELPEGADAVLPRELVEAEAGQDPRISFGERPRAGQHIRSAGEDLKRGAVALTGGTRLGAAALGLAASLDAIELSVARRPRVTVLCTGDELRPAGSPGQPGKIPDSISLPLATLATLAGAEARIAPHVADDRAATERALAAALADTDLLLTVGGVSVGDHDWVRPSLAARGVVLDFWKVAIKPGKPIAFGRNTAGTSVLGLPGNPASALVTFALFGMPFLRALQGDRQPLPKLLRLPLGGPVRHKAGRLEFVRAELVAVAGALTAVPLENQASGALTSLAWADALVLVPAEVEGLEAGTSVEVLRLQDC